MPVPGIEEVLSGLQRQSMNIPIKKRRFPIVRSESSPEEEAKPCGSEDSEFNKKQDLGILDEQFAKIARNVDSSSSCDAIKFPDSIGKSEQQGSHVADTKTPQQEKPCVCLGFTDDARNKVDVLSKEKNPVTDVPQSNPVERNSALEGPKGNKMNVGLSIGSKESLVPPTVKQEEEEEEEEIGCKSGKSDPALSGLSSCKEMPVMHGKSNSDANQANDEVYSDRSNWDLNTTMDVWFGSTSGDTFTNSSFDNTELSKTEDCRPDAKSSLIMSDTTDLGLNTKDVLSEYRSDVSSRSEQPNLQRKVDFFTGFRVDLPYSGINSIGNHSATLSKLLSANVVGPNLSLQLAQLPATSTNLIRCPTVKVEPVDQVSKPTSSIGSSSSSNIELSNPGSVKRELIENQSAEAVVPSSKRDLILNNGVEYLMPSYMSPQGLVEDRSIKSELVQEANQESCVSKIVESQRSVWRVMQHQESCASSSVLPVSLTPPDLCRPTSSICLKQTMNGNQVILSEKPKYVLDRTVDAMISEPSEQSGKELTLYKVGEKSKSDDSDYCKEAFIDNHLLGLGKNVNVAANHKEQTSMVAETRDKASSRSDSVPHENHVDTSTNRRDRIHTNEDEYEDGEIREPLRNSAGEVLIGERKKIDQNNQCDISNSQSSVPLYDEVASESGLGKTDASLIENHDENCGGPVEESLVVCHEPNTANDAVQKVSVQESDVEVDEGSSISTTADKQLVTNYLDESSGKDFFNDRPPDQTQGIVTELENKARDNFDKVISSRNKDSTLSVPEASPKCNDTAKDCNNRGSTIESNSMGNKSRIINLPSSLSASTFGKSKHISNKLLTSKRGQERDTNFDREIMPRGRRFAEDKIHDHSFRRSGPNFRHERTMSSGYGSAQNDWGSGRAEAYNRPPNDRVVRCKYTSIPEFEREPYNNGVAPDNSFNRRRPLNDDISSFRRTSIWRQSPGDIDVSVARDIQKHKRIPRNISPSPCNAEDSSTFVGFRHADKFLRRLSSDNVVNPVYNRSRVISDVFDDQMSRGNRRFSPIQRKGLLRVRSKSPIRSRTRSPGPCTSPHRRSPGVFRRTRSPDRVFHEEIVPRRRASSPSFGARRLRDLRDIEPLRENIRYRNVNSNNRSSPPLRLLQRSTRKGDDSLGDGDEFIGGPMKHSKGSNFHGDDSCIDERRKFIEKRGHVRSFGPSYNDDDNESFQFPTNDGPRVYGFCRDSRQEFNGHMKYQISIRLRGGIDEQHDGNYRPSGRVWCDDDFTEEVSGDKRRRY